jgi:hypothetical protein
VFSIASYGLSEFYWYLIAGMSVVLRNLLGAEAKLAAAGQAGSIRQGPVAGRVAQERRPV